MSIFKYAENLTLYKNIRKKSFIALGIIAITLIIGYLAIFSASLSLPKDTGFFRDARGQRMLSQRIAFLIKEREDLTQSADASEIQNQLDVALNLIEKGHNSIIKRLQNDNIDPKIKVMYFGPNGLNDRIRMLISEARNKNYSSPIYRYKSMGELWKDLNAALNLIENQITQDSTVAHIVEIASFILGFAVLILSGFFIFKPMALDIAVKNDDIMQKGNQIALEKHNTSLLLLVATFANKANKVDEILEKVLSKICVHMGWSIGHAYTQLSDIPDILVSKKTWYADKNLTDLTAFEEYKAYIEKSVITGKKETDLARAVMGSKVPIWVNDLEKYKDALGIDFLMQLGVNSIFFCPVIVKENIVMLLTFCSEKDVADEYTSALTLVEYIAQTIGQIYERERASKEIDKLNNTLSNLVVVRTKELEQLEKLEKISVRNAYQAGMSEIATEILHNVGNILNSISVGIEIIISKHDKSAVDAMVRANELLKENSHNLIEFLTKDVRGSKIVEYYFQLTRILKSEMIEQKNEAEELESKLQVIKDIIRNQQKFAKECTDAMEEVSLEEVVENALLLQISTFLRYEIQIIKKFSKVPTILAHRSKLVHVVINLIKNAKEAVHDGNGVLKQVIIEIFKTENGNSCLKISDTGVGMTQETLEKIFTYGFTTKQYGHGFGLHSCILALQSMSAEISVTSEGLNKGSQFTVTFPDKEFMGELSDEKTNLISAPEAENTEFA